MSVTDRPARSRLFYPRRTELGHQIPHKRAWHRRATCPALSPRIELGAVDHVERAAARSRHPTPPACIANRASSVSLSGAS